ncbi:MAG: amidohydrolase [Planctomycetes bacterium]|nr:amidohydrolase [Planctomycetota bacterium]
MPFLADFHTHLFSRTLFEALAAASPLRGTTAERTERVTRGLDVALPSADAGEHLARWLDEMERHGVSHMVSFASAPEEHAVLAELAAHTQGRISFFAFVDPRQSGAAAELARLLEHGTVRGALFFPALHHYRADGPEAAAVFEVLDAHGAPAVVHCGLLRMPLRERYGLPHRVDLACANPLTLVPPAERFASMAFVVPHFGAGFLRETLLAGAQCGNIHVDTSSSQAWLATEPARLSLADVFERALAVFGSGRILFGTDSSVFPRGWRRDLLLAQREALGACGVREEDRARILGMNAAQLLRISP